MHVRLLIQPVVAMLIAIRAGLKDARSGQPAYLWAILTNRAERGRLVHSGWKDIGRVFVVAFLLDTLYQTSVLRRVHPVQGLIVAAMLAVMPYLLFRGPICRLVRRFYKRKASAANDSGGNKGSTVTP